MNIDIGNKQNHLFALHNIFQSEQASDFQPQRTVLTQSAKLFTT